MKRILTALIAAPLALAAVFYLPRPWFFVALTVVMEFAVLEYAQLTERLAPGGPSKMLLLLVPAAALALTPELWSPTGGPAPMLLMSLVFLVLSVGCGSLVLLFRTPVEQGMVALGALAFGIPYLALPLASLHRLQQLDPWLLVLLLAIVWLGDTAAYYCGRAWGRHKMAPRVSPNKTWEGAVASLLAAVVAAASWSALRLGQMEFELLGLAAVTSLAAQLGDLVESLIKRNAGVKDSGSLLPGHGGMLDRLDALLFAAPTLLLGLTLVDPKAWLP